MKKKLQIFISSTYSDLVEERQAAVSAILKAGHIPAGMELFTSGDESQMETIKRWIDESDVFMLILGGRYGSIEPNTSLSYTELEYDYAVKSGKPFFAVVIEELALEQKLKNQGSRVIEIENAGKLDAFRKKVLSRTSAFFKDVQDIRLAVYETISDFLGRYDFKGWVSGEEIPDIQSFTDQINMLREENKRLTEDKNALSQGEFFTPSEEREFEHIRQKLDRDIDLTVMLFKQSKDDNNRTKTRKEIYKVNLLNVVFSYVNRGYTNFDRLSLAIIALDKLNDRLSQNETPTTSREPAHPAIKDNLSLEFQTYGLSKFAEENNFSPSDTTCTFTDKMYRFRYWLDYNNYTPEINFELVSKTEEATPETSSPTDSLPVLPTIKEIDRTLNFRTRRNKWRTTKEGVTSAQHEFESLCEELSLMVDRSNKESETFKIDFSRDDNHCKLFSMGVSLSITWNCKDAMSLSGSVLSVIGDKIKFEIDGIESFYSQDKFYENEFDIDMNKDFQIVWIRRSDNSVIRTNELVSSLLTNLLKAIHTRIIQRK